MLVEQLEDEEDGKTFFVLRIEGLLDVMHNVDPVSRTLNKKALKND